MANCGVCRHRPRQGRLTWEQSGPWLCQTERRGLGNGQAHQAASTGRPQSALSISFEPLCAFQSVGLQGGLRNRSEKNRLVQTYELRSALTIIRRGSLSASRIYNEITILEVVVKVV